MPEKYRDLGLKATRGETSGHYGIKKTYNHVLQHFYWPRIKRDVARFVRSCHFCQVAGKPNETIRPAPLRPFQFVDTPLDRVSPGLINPNFRLF